MSMVKISPKFQVVIPKSVRESLELLPGQEMDVIEYDGKILFIPIIKVESLQGILKGMDTSAIRDKSDRI